MHNSLCPDVKAHVDTVDASGTCTGWAFHTMLGVLPLRLTIADTIVTVTTTDRKDVASFYKLASLGNCGWSVNRGENLDGVLEMNIQDVWTPILKLDKRPVQPVGESLFSTYKAPTYIVVDNFYANPDHIREFALQQTFHDNPAYYKGRRAFHPSFRFPGLKEQFERILGAKIKNWDTYGTNGCFQYCIAGDQAVYHFDVQEYAGVLFLTPDAPPQTGTSFFRSKHTKQMKLSTTDYHTVFKTGHYDSTQFDQVDVVGNVYNRLVLFDARLFHAAPLYFGTDLHNGRLFQLFFFDLDV